MQALQITLSEESIEAHCAELAKQSRTPEQGLTALVTLQSCIADHTTPGNRADPNYRAIQGVIERHAASAREKVITETGDALVNALQKKDCGAITRAHGALSRNGFWQAAGRAARQFDPESLIQTENWLHAWCIDAKMRAQAASPYPDAPDFKAAGVVPQEYAAMDEIRRALEAADSL